MTKRKRAISWLLLFTMVCLIANKIHEKEWLEVTRDISDYKIISEADFSYQLSQYGLTLTDAAPQDVITQEYSEDVLSKHCVYGEEFSDLLEDVELEYIKMSPRNIPYSILKSDQNSYLVHTYYIEDNRILTTEPWFYSPEVDYGKLNRLGLIISSLQDVQKTDPHGSYIALHTSGNANPPFSTHCTDKGIGYEITYDYILYRVVNIKRGIYHAAYPFWQLSEEDKAYMGIESG